MAGHLPDRFSAFTHMFRKKFKKQKKKAAGGVGMNWPPGILYGKQAVKYTQ